MSFSDGLVGFANALPGVTGQVLQTYAQTQAQDRQKQADRDKQDDAVLKLFENSEKPELRSLAVIGRMRQAQPDYKPGKKGLVLDLLGKQLHEHPEWEELHKALQMTSQLQKAHEGPMGPPAPPTSTVTPPSSGTPEGGSELDLMPGGGGGASPTSSSSTPPSMPSMPTMGASGDAGAAPGAMPGTTYGMPAGSMMTPDNPSTPMMPTPPPSGGPAAPVSAAPVAAAPAAGPSGGPPPIMGVHPELQAILRDAQNGSAVGDVKAAADETGKAFGEDVLGGYGPRGEAAFKAGASDRIGRKETLRVAASQAAAQDKEKATTARAVQSAKDALERTTLRTDSAMERLKEAEKLRRGRPAKERQAPQMNMQKELVDIERDALKDKASVQKEIDHQLITVRAEAEKNFTSPAKLAQLEEQITTMGRARLGVIDDNKTKATEFLGNMMQKQVTAGAPPRLGDKVQPKGGAAAGAGAAPALTAADFPKNAATGTVFQGYKRVDGGWQKVK